MSQPRQILPGKTVMVTRRCLQRRFFLIPSPMVNDILKYVLARGAAMFGVEFHAIVFMSNHYHILLTDMLGQLPRFMHWVNREMSRAIGEFRGVEGGLFAPGSYNMVTLESPEAVLDKLAYIALNPVTARLVKRPSQWEGLLTLPEQLGTDIATRIPRPKVYFRRRAGVTPPTLSLTVPPMLRHMPLQNVVTAVRQRMDERSEPLTGSVLGMRRVLRTPLGSRPKTQELRGQRIPALSAVHPELWKLALKRLRGFRQAYRIAFERYREHGFTDGFPPGTWAMVQNCGALRHRRVLPTPLLV